MMGQQGADKSDRKTKRGQGEDTQEHMGVKGKHNTRLRPRGVKKSENRYRQCFCRSV